MNKKYKKIFEYAIVMCACVLIIVLFGCLTENKLEDYQEQYDENMTLSQKQIEVLEKRIETLQKENTELSKKLETNMSIAADVATGQQAMSDLKEIYYKYRSGKVNEAKSTFEKIEPIGFDDATLAYYEILSDILKK